MGYSELGQEVPEINDRSTIPDLIGLLLSSFRERDFKLVERILLTREEDLKRQLKKEKQEHSLLQKIHGESELEKFDLQEELKKLKREKEEVEEAAQLYRQKLPLYEERITYLEKAVAGVMGTDVSEIGKHCAYEGSLDCKQTVENASNHRGNAESSYGAQSPENGPLCEPNSSHQEKQSDYPCKALTSINRTFDKEFHDKSTEVVPSSVPITVRPRSPIVVEIIESDDEAPGDENPHVLNACASKVNSSKNGETFTGSGTQTKDLKNLLPKRKRSLTESDDNDSSPFSMRKKKLVRELLHDGKDSIVNNCSVKLESTATGAPFTLSSAQCQMLNKRHQVKAEENFSLQTATRKFDSDTTDDSSDYGSTDSEDEGSDCINNIIASLHQKSRKSQKIWNLAADMRSEFQEDNELCMNAVCALYRKKISAEKSIDSTSSPTNLGFYLFDAMSGKDLAEFLINGDPQYKLNRTVSELQQKDPRLLDRCRHLAIHYHKILFEIYREKEDPFFHPRS